MQSIVAHNPYLTPREAAPIRQPNAWQRLRTYAMPLTRVSWNALLFAAVAVMFVVYWWVSNQLVSLGFSLEETQDTVAHMRIENRERELSAMNEESYRSVSERVAKLEMVPVSDIEYIEALSHNVARR